MIEYHQNGDHQEIDGVDRVYYEGYWIRYYTPPPETLEEKRKLIQRLTRRAFHHTESGINTPGSCLEEARAAYLEEDDADRKRVNAAMLAGALFNRGTDIFTTIVDLEQKQVAIGPDNELMRQCGECLGEALELGRQVKHFSGHEGVDELWGEPMKAFTMSIADFYSSRYVKMAWTLRDIDRISAVLCEVATAFDLEFFCAAFDDYRQICKEVCETAKDDSHNFHIWPRYVVARERIDAYCQHRSQATDLARRILDDDVYRLMAEGKELLGYLSGTRVPMPTSMRELLDKCAAIRARQEHLARTG